LSLFDHLVGAGDDEFDFCRRLHWKISRLFTLEDTVDVSGRAP
jgi:hypothetical protein